MTESTSLQPPVSRRKLRRLVALFVLGGALIVGALAYRYYWLARPLGSGSAGPSVARQAFETTWTDRPVLLLGIGDSITAGLGASEEKSYFKRLIANPPDEFPELEGICLTRVLPNLRAENLAISGSTSLHHLEIVREQLTTQPADTLGLVVLTTGGNDLIHSYGRRPPMEGAMYGATLAQAQPWINNYEQRLNAMLDLITACFPGGCHIFLADIYDPTDGLGDAQNAGLPPWPDGLEIHRRYNDIIQRCAATRDHVRVVPLYQEFLGHGIHCRQFWRATYRAEDPYYWYYVNLEDPNNRGYDAIRRLYLNEIARVADQFRAAASPAQKSFENSPPVTDQP